LRRFAVAAILVMAAIGGWAFTSHRLSYVVTHGVSMQPLYHDGDLVFVAKADSYEIGQIAAYHGGAGGRVEVLHRIIGGDPETGFILKGDNKQSTDVDRPTADQLIGRAVLHVPHGGVVLRPMLSPTGLGMIGFLFASGGAVAAKSRRDVPRGRRKKKVKGMSGGGGSWATAAVVFKAVKRLHPALRALAIITALFTATGFALGLLGWMKPTTEAVAYPGQSGESMTFSYSADVIRSAAYDGTTVYSPDPIFRRLANLVDLNVNYTGTPGRIQVNARMSAQNGWHTTLQLSQQQQFTSGSFAGKVQLDLNALEGRARAAGEAIGADMGAVIIAITAQVEHDDGATFEPQISLNLAPLQLTLTGGAEVLVVKQSSTAAGVSLQARQIGAFGYDIVTAADARKYAAYLLLTAIIGAVIVAMSALRHVPLRTRVQIQRRYPHLLVPVEPMASPPGKPVVVVDTFPALVKLAEKYGQMILTWTRPDGADDFVVRDEGILYRYRIEPPPAAPAIPARSGAQQTDRPRVDEVVTEATPVPALQLPPAPEPPPEFQAEPEPPDAGDEPSGTEETPAEKAAPRKRASRTTAAKAATKTAAATKATATKRTAAKAPAKRTRAPSNPSSQPETTLATAEIAPVQQTSADVTPAIKADQPTSADIDIETVASANSETGGATTDVVTTGSGEPAEAQEATVAAEATVDQATETGPAETEPSTADIAPGTTEPSRTEPEAAGPTETGTEPEAPEQPGPGTAGPKPARSQKRADRRKSRSRKATQPAVDEPTADRTPPTNEPVSAASAEGDPLPPGEPAPQPAPQPAPEPAARAREAMENLAERNRPITAPEPEPTREPIYDFLPAEKRAAGTPDLDDDADEA
jgi:signal peptidase I